MEIKRIDGLNPVIEVRKVGRKLLSDKKKHSGKNKKEKSFKEFLEEKKKDEQ